MKRPISATIEVELIEWINSKCMDKARFRNKSHLIEIALDLLRQEDQKKR